MNLKEKPFFLNDGDLAWVQDTLTKMSLDEKIGQLFCMITYSCDEIALKDLVEDIQPGGLMCRPMPAAETIATINTVQRHSKIPMLIAANLESGGNGIITEGTKIGSPMQVSATNDVNMAEKLGIICAEEGLSVGANWAFAPIVDIDYNFRNPITNTRTFGSNPNIVETMGLAYINAVQSRGMAATAKHFPGDGVDERDHHLVTSINDLSVEEWDRTYGKIYQSCIDAGVMSIMAGHISLPEYVKKYSPDILDENILPASLSYEVLTELLRGKLGFNGLIVSDATTMAGMSIPMPREKAVPTAIACGCDMFLFTKNMKEDVSFMKAGVKNGIITPNRLDEAVTRILAMKATLRLHEKKEKGQLFVSDSEKATNGSDIKFKEWAVECADKAITLVKEEKGVLPISLEKHKRILLYGIEANKGFTYSVRTGVVQEFIKLLRNEGFCVEEFDSSVGQEGRLKPTSDIVGKYDLIIYVANLATKSNQTSVRIEWEMPMGLNVPIYIESVPTIFISVENPYHLLDVPRIKTFINTYSSTNEVLESLVKKLIGKSQFTGNSPVDAFCGKWDTRL